MPIQIIGAITSKLIQKNITNPHRSKSSEPSPTNLFKKNHRSTPIQIIRAIRLRERGTSSVREREREREEMRNTVRIK